MPHHLDRVLVPVRIGAAGAAALTLARRPDGTRTGLAFTSRVALERVLGPGSAHLVLALPALHSTLREIGVTAVQVDPEAVARPAAAYDAAS